MASEIRVNSIKNRSGLGTITVSDSGAVFSGVTTFAQIQTTSGEITVGTGASVFSPATNVLALGTNNAEKVRITSTGSVGIGTDNPTRRLHVQSPGSTSNALFGNSANNNSIEVTRTGSTASYFQVQTYTNICNVVGGPTLTFKTSDPIGSASTERLRITSGGIIKFAENNSTTDYLQWGSNPRLFLQTPTGINGLRIYSDTTPIEIGTNDLSRKISVGSGPNHDISISGDYSLSAGGYDSSPKVFFNTTRHNGSTTVTSFQTAIQAVSSSNTAGDGYLGLGASASPDDLVIRPSGNIGIGTDNPRTKLDVDGGLIVKVSGTQPAWVSNAIAGQEKFSIWQGASFDNACFSLDVDNSQSFLNHNVYYYNSSWRQRLGGHTPIMIQLSSSNGVVFQKSSDNGAGTNDTATTLTELCRINTSGNLVFPSGQGIDFSATADGSGTDSSELLDDYEEGTFTAEINFDNLSLSSHTTSNGFYVKVGRHVRCDIFIRFNGSNLSGTPATNAGVWISGLPYAGQIPARTTQWVGNPVAMGRLPEYRGRNDSTDFNKIYLYMGDNSSVIYLGVNKDPQSPISTDFLYGMSEKSFSSLIGAGYIFELRTSFSYMAAP